MDEDTASMEQWPASTPSSLEDLCIQTCLHHLHTICRVMEDRQGDGVTLTYVKHPDLHLQLSLCEKLVRAFAADQPLSDGFLHFFSSQGTSLATLPLRCSDVTCAGLKHVSQHHIVSMDLSHCAGITSDVLPLLNHGFRSLRSLRFGGQPHILDVAVPAEEDLEEDGDFNSNACVRLAGGGERVFGRDFVLDLPQLTQLVLQDVVVPQHRENLLLTPLLLGLPGLRQLDLTGCQVDLHNLDAFDELPRLLSLGLGDVEIPDPQLPVLIQHLAKLKELRHLDLSQSESDMTPVVYSQPEERLRQLVVALPRLVSLDISGTNLAGLDSEDPPSHKPLPAKVLERQALRTPPSSIRGLEGRHFQFLGLLGCADSPCSRTHIPADKYTGGTTEELVLYSCEVYRDKAGLLIWAFNSLFNLFRHESVHNQHRALQALLAGMKQHPKDKHVCISGSASLFYIAKGVHRSKLSWTLKKQIIETLLVGMQNFYYEQTMMRNACLTLCHFDIPKEVLYCYQRLVSVLLKMLEHEHPDDFIQRIGIYLINCLACQVDGREKEFVGDQGAIEIMLRIIRRKLATETCDEAMEVAWSTMWNVTDETPANCQKFLDSDGMTTFLECLEKFHCKPELLRNMMGLMGNIAEVKELRPVLMTREYVSVFSELLDSPRDGIEVSYNAAGVISHLAFDGAEAWTLRCPQRHEVLQRMRDAISRWSLDSQRNINYRSFEPILRLVADFSTPEVQLWGTWALCNLTGVYPQKYCGLLEREGGVRLLGEMLADPRLSQDVRALVVKTQSQVAAFLSAPSPPPGPHPASHDHSESDMEGDE